jgi:quercetin dioxygenase-like cupin family protein
MRKAKTKKDRPCASDSGALPSARALELAGLVDYAPGSIVSRTIAKNRAGTLTLFAFDAGQELSEHQAPFDAFVHVVDGEAELIIDGRPVRTRAGEIAVMPADVPHAVRARRRFKMLLLMLRAPRK